jgi:hypothetical protein
MAAAKSRSYVEACLKKSETLQMPFKQALPVTNFAVNKQKEKSKSSPHCITTRHYSSPYGPLIKLLTIVRKVHNTM